MKKKIRKWFDGDSGEFTDGTKFRLANVRAPEKYQLGGKKATKVVAGMTGRSKGTISWKSVAVDKSGRAVGNMSNKDGSINTRMRNKKYVNRGR